MIRNLKVLGLALVAVFAFAAISASAASAQGTLTAPEGSVTLTGKETGPVGNNQLTAFGVGVTCEGSTYTGHALNSTNPLNAGAKTVTVTPHYLQANCRAAGFPATVDMNGCDYVLLLGGTTGTDEYGVTSDLVCPAGKDVTVTVFWDALDHAANTPFCVFHVAPQAGLLGAEAKDTTNGHIDLTGSVNNIHIVGTDPTTHPLLCPVTGDQQTVANGKLDLDLTVSGDTPGTSTPTKVGLTHP